MAAPEASGRSRPPDRSPSAAARAPGSGVGALKVGDDRTQLADARDVRAEEDHASRLAGPDPCE